MAVTLTDGASILETLTLSDRPLARPGEILVTSTVKDLVAGSGIKFNDRGTRTLKGVPDQWRVFTAEA